MRLTFCVQDVSICVSYVSLCLVFSLASSVLAQLRSVNYCCHLSESSRLLSYICIFTGNKPGYTDNIQIFSSVSRANGFNLPNIRLMRASFRNFQAFFCLWVCPPAGTSPLWSATQRSPRNVIHAERHREPFLARFNKQGDRNRWGAARGAWHRDVGVVS